MQTFQDFLEAFQDSDTFTRYLEQEADRSCHEEGMFGLTHDQTIDAWLEFLRDELIGLKEETYYSFATEIASTRAWHRENNSLEELT